MMLQKLCHSLERTFLFSTSTRTRRICLSHCTPNQMLLVLTASQSARQPAEEFSSQVVVRCCTYGVNVRVSSDSQSQPRLHEKDVSSIFLYHAKLPIDGNKKFTFESTRKSLKTNYKHFVLFEILKDLFTCPSLVDSFLFYI